MVAPPVCGFEYDFEDFNACRNKSLYVLQFLSLRRTALPDWRRKATESKKKLNVSRACKTSSPTRTYKCLQAERQRLNFERITSLLCLELIFLVKPEIDARPILRGSRRLIKFICYNVLSKNYLIYEMASLVSISKIAVVFRRVRIG
jgi:hypothetical protein